MSMSRRKFTKEFKEAAIRRLELGASLAEVARQCEVDPNLLHRWKRELREMGAQAFAGQGKKGSDESRLADLERKVGRQAMEIDFLKKMLAACRGAAETAGIDFARLVYGFLKEEMNLATLIPVNRMCALAGISRPSFYRSRQAGDPTDPHMDLRDEIQRIALEWPSYGWRRIRKELNKIGWKVNHKLIRRIMREDNLLCLRRRRFVVTTDSNHALPVYRNLAKAMELTGIDQLWVADITYIRLETEFVYLAVVLDAYSRRVVGWALDRTLEAKLAVQALQMAIRQRSPQPGLVHHSDRGVQYASTEYMNLLKDHQILPSMSRRGNPYDNAKCESFMKTLKYEEVYRQEYRDLAEARRSIQRFIEKVYNARRMHSALDYRSPVEFEHDIAARAAQPETKDEGPRHAF